MTEAAAPSIGFNSQLSSRSGEFSAPEVPSSGNCKQLDETGLLTKSMSRFCNLQTKEQKWMVAQSGR